jgi:hypothetical protein
MFLLESLGIEATTEAREIYCPQRTVMTLASLESISRPDSKSTQNQTKARFDTDKVAVLAENLI